MRGKLEDHTYNLSLWLEHPNADLSEVPAKLGLHASRLWRKGDPITTPKGRVMDGFYQKSYCNIEFAKDDQSELSAGLKSALAWLLPHRKYLEELSKDGVQIRFFVGWFSNKLNSREILTWEILRDMAELHISLDLDFYSPDKAEE